MIAHRLWMMSNRLVRLTLLTAATLLGLAGANAQETKHPKGSPIGGPSWNANVTTDTAVAGITLDAKQVATVKTISAYFNNLENLKGAFVQTVDAKRLRGKFFVKRPGRLRFEYALPSKQLIVSDGQWLSIQDHDLNTDDRIALDQTPFRLLLRKDVDLIRDARIFEVQEAADLVIVTLQDKSPDAPGRIKLFLGRGTELELREWVTTDAQGVETRVEVSNLIHSEEIDATIFKIVSPAFKKLQ